MGVSSLHYANMFDEKLSSDAMEWDEMNEGMGKNDNGGMLNECLLRELHFNWLRFVEYSGSGSLVLFTIALLSGIVDIELLMCMFALSFICMMLGIVAEFALRAKVVLEKVVEYTQNNSFALGGDGQVTNDTLHPLRVMGGVVQNMIDKIHWCFWMAHILCWIGILILWAIIVVHYMSWWSGCSAETMGMPSSWLDNILTGGECYVCHLGYAHSTFIEKSSSATKQTMPECYGQTYSVTANFIDT